MSGVDDVSSGITLDGPVSTPLSWMLVPSNRISGTAADGIFEADVTVP